VAPRIAAAREIATRRTAGTAERAADRSVAPAAPAGSDLVSSAAWSSWPSSERASGRGTERILRVARTIADLGGEAEVREAHVEEAAWYRPPDLRLLAAEVG
jgi:magnesium chelatase family protein